MVSEQILIDTVERMVEAGIDDATIVSTLADAGMSNEQALALIEKVKTPAPVEPQNPQEDTGEIKSLRTELEAQARAHEMNTTSTQVVLDDHEEKLNSISSQVDEVKSSFSKPPVLDGAISQRISSLEQKVDEVSASSKAMLDLMKKMLETNRSILTELESKK